MILFDKIHIRKPSSLRGDVSLLTTVAKTLFYETFREDNTEENMKAYLEQAFNPTQQTNELQDPNTFIAFIEMEWDDELNEYLQQKCSSLERIQFLESQMSYVQEPEEEDMNSSNTQIQKKHTKKLVIAYCKLKYGAFEPCLKYQGNETIELCRCYVLKEFHGTCIAHRLMQECLRVAREVKFGMDHQTTCKSIWLGVWERNARAKKFYEKYKFEKVGEHVFVMGDDPQRDEIYELILN
ncbi:hypothetical protein C9374_002815 [Naegleria lovaniensis]|uniref:N-acetyltransferase domain-containing protein n=1 Tax=Naegleria lovaniensis TaxID=51637 RepID=A0AA88GUG0_NAELO|nr:uncharacterized protein C9374_002815 [Naegleria lovaniensis]KAG2386369.1 hypothetical protein C9374_002815 [Naegleria lovaniensis]